MQKKLKPIVTILVAVILCFGAGAQYMKVFAKTNVKKVEKTLQKGKSFKISKKLYNSSVRKVTFTSSKKKVAAVSKKGVVKGKKIGTARITIKKKETGAKIAIIVVRVKNNTASEPSSTEKPIQPTAAPGGQTNTPEPISAKFEVEKIQLPKCSADDITIPEEEYDTLTILRNIDGNSFIVFYTLNGNYVAGNGYYSETYYEDFYNTYSSVLGEDEAHEYVNNLKAMCAKLQCGIYEMVNMPFLTDTLEEEKAAYEAQGYTVSDGDVDVAKSEVLEMAEPSVYDKITLLKAENGSAVVVFSKDDVVVGGDMYFGAAYLDYMLSMYSALLGDEIQAADMVNMVTTTAIDLGNGIYSMSSVSAGTSLEEAVVPYSEYTDVEVTTLEDVASEFESFFFK